MEASLAKSFVERKNNTSCCRNNLGMRDPWLSYKVWAKITSIPGVKAAARPARPEGEKKGKVYFLSMKKAKPIP